MSKTYHCHVHNKDYTSAGGCWYCREEYKNLSDMDKTVTITKLCGCGTRNAIRITRGKETAEDTCSFCGKLIIATRF